MSKFAQVAVNVPGVVDLFDYAVPDSWQGICQPGSLAEVPFGKQTVQGVVISLEEHSEIANPRLMQSLLDEEPVLSPKQIALGRFLSDTYLAPLAEYLNAMLPPGLAQRADTLYSLNLPENNEPDTLTDLQRRVLTTLQKRGALRGRQLEVLFRHVNWQAALRALMRRGWVISRPVLPPPAVSRKFTRLVRLNIAPEAVQTIGEQLGKPGSTAFARRMAVLQALASQDEAVDVSWVYAAAGAQSADIRYLEQRSLVTIHSQAVWRDPLAETQVDVEHDLQLTSDQEKAWHSLLQALNQEKPKAPVLLHGVTGSGKTELYLRIIRQVLARKQQAIVLVPEIALTPQTIQRFLARFPGQVGVVHSRLSAGERLDTWLRARQAEFSIVIGPRSALFTPFPNLGAIILDECHEDAFIQTDIPPYYHAREAAIAYARLCNALLVMGSATPDVALYQRVKKESWPLLELPRRVLAHAVPSDKQQEKDKSLPLPEVQVVDMRAELKSGNTSILSSALQTALQLTLERQQQAILLLNRRGSATYIFCRDCGYALKCPRCELPLTLHSAQGTLLCHTCGYSRQPPQFCPQCRGRRIRQFGSGTEKLADVLQDTFPNARVLRWDADSTRAKDAQDVILSQFRHQHADVLIGTQMLAKGLDLPQVTLVGVVLADVGLNFPDYRSAERTFQLLTQVAGRAGRSQLGGQVVLQSFQPEHYAIQHAARHDFAGFYAQEIAYRRQLNYPPFVRMVRFEVRHSDRQRAQQAAQHVHEHLLRLVNASRDRTHILLAPTPPFFAKRAGQYRWQVILKGARPLELIRGEDWRDVRIEVDPPSLL